MEPWCENTRASYCLLFTVKCLWFPRQAFIKWGVDLEALIIDENFLINALFCILLARTHYYIKVSLDILMIFMNTTKCQDFVSSVLESSPSEKLVGISPNLFSFSLSSNIFRPKRKTLQQKCGFWLGMVKKCSCAHHFPGSEKHKSDLVTERGLGEIGEQRHLKHFGQLQFWDAIFFFFNLNVKDLKSAVILNVFCRVPEYMKCQKFTIHFWYISFFL